MLKCAGTDKEVSCIIGNLFAELEPPCSACEGEPQGVKICGTTYSGKRAVLILAGDCFYFDGDGGDLEKIRGKRCARWLNNKNS